MVCIDYYHIICLSVMENFFYYTVEWGRDTGGCGDYPYSGGDGDYTGDGGTDGQPNEEQRL